MFKSFIFCALTLLLCTSSTRLRAVETASPMTKTNAVTVDSKEFEVALQAAEKGDLAPMKMLIANGLDVNKSGKEAPPLFYAAVASPALVKLFLDKGADVNFQTPDEMTALKMSVIGNNTEIVQLLIRRGARVNDAEKDGMTVLISNVLMGSVEMARVLLKNGANVNMADHDGNTALMTASSLRKVEMVRLFLHAGADVLHQDKRGETALSNARSFLQVGDLLGRSIKETASERASRLEGREILTMLEAAEKRAKSRRKSSAPKGTS